MEPLAALVGLCLVALVLAGGLVLLYVSRQRALCGRVGSFGCDLRPTSSGPWSAGIAHYSTERLLWWRTLSLVPRPAHSWSRTDLRVTGRVRLDLVDEAGRPMLLIDCEHGGETFQLTVSEPACAGLVSWLESGPRPVGRVV